MPISANTLKKYLNPVFIETGSQFGDGIQTALDAGFISIFSVETSKESFEHCKKRFADNDFVCIEHGQSDYFLSTLISPDVLRCTFWLDAHNENDYPVLKELDCISDYQVKTHTILIDDLRMFPTDKNGLTLDQIKAKILSINPDYKFKFEDGHVPNDILVAYV